MNAYYRDDKKMYKGDRVFNLGRPEYDYDGSIIESRYDAIKLYSNLKKCIVDSSGDFLYEVEYDERISQPNTSGTVYVPYATIKKVVSSGEMLKILKESYTFKDNDIFAFEAKCRELTYAFAEGKYTEQTILDFLIELESFLKKVNEWKKCI